MAAKPTVLVVAGAWHGPTHYKPLTDALAAAGYGVSHFRLPTNTAELHSKVPRPGLRADAETIQAELKRLIEVEQRDVLIMPHSYGGMPSLQAIEPSMTRKTRLMQGGKGGIIGILAYCSFLIPNGACLEDLTGGKRSPFVALGENGMTHPMNPAHVFYNDMTADEKSFYVSLLTEHPTEVHTTHLAADPVAYKYLPTGYVICEQDNAIPVVGQEQIVERVRSDGGLLEHVYRLDSSHSPMISRPKDLVQIAGIFLESVQASS